jgi:hypothetical protein
MALRGVLAMVAEGNIAEPQLQLFSSSPQLTPIRSRRRKSISDMSEEDNDISRVNRPIARLLTHTLDADHLIISRHGIQEWPRDPHLSTVTCLERGLASVGAPCRCLRQTLCNIISLIPTPAGPVIPLV